MEVAAMAQQQEKVRGLYMKSAGDSTAQKDTNLDKSVEKTRKENKGKLKEYFGKPRTKRPTREVYQPGITRLSRRTEYKGEERFKKSTSGTDGFTSDDESYRDSKDSSMEKEIDSIAGTLNTFYVHGSNSLPRKPSQLASQDPRKTSTLTYKKPEIPRYIPRAKLIEQSSKSDTKADVEQKEILSSSGSNRKVDIKHDLNKMVVTVLNDQLEVGGGGGSGGQSRRNNSQLLNLQFHDKADGHYREEEFYRSPKHRGSLDYSRESEAEAPISPGGRMCRYKFEGMRKSIDYSRDDDCDSVSSQSQRQSKRRSYTKTKCYTSQYRRQRTGSISSEFSAASDASMEDVNGGQTFDWDEDVEHQMSKSVHEELREGTQKIQQMTEDMQNMDYLGKQPRCGIVENRRVRTESSGSNYSDQLSHVRSRKRDRRRSSRHSKTESRDSSIQSNPSKEYDPERSGEGSRKGKGRGRRKKTTYESSKNNEQENDLRKLGIKVTFGKSDRQVEVNQAANGKSGENKNSEKSSAPRGGGIIHLPHNVSTVPDHQSHFGPQSDTLQPSLPPRNMQSRPREQGGEAKKKLFDPKNPKKPIIIKNSILKFYDTYEHSDSIDAYPRNLPVFYSDSNNPDGTTYRGSPSSPHSDPYLSRFHTLPKEIGLSSDDIFNQDSCYQKSSSRYPSAGPPKLRKYQFETMPREYGQGLDVCNPPRSRAHCRTMAEQLFHDSLPIEGQLSNMVSRGLQPESMNKLSQLRLDLQTKCEQIILLDLEVSIKQNVEQLLWKSVYYQLIEIYRKQLAEEPSTRNVSTESIKEQLFTVLDEGTSFYEGLLEHLQTTYNFSLTPFLDTNGSPPETCNRTVKLALLTSQRIMICLGDIARYRELANDSTNYGRARSWYMRAQQLAPKNGRPYNQLAILALYTKRKLDSVYYYMRSLAASNPFMTARESLMSLFDEARKRAEASEKKRMAEREKIEKLKSQQRQQGQRREIWVAPDGTSHEDKLEDSYEEDLSKLPLDKLNRRFVQSFLNVHGKLFTKIGMETFQEMCSQMLREFHTLLQQAHPTITNVRILQLMAINMFTIENTTLKGDHKDDEDCRLLLQEYAVQLGLDMFAILVDRCAELLHNHLQCENSAREILSYTLSHYVPAVKVWTDWMICHLQLWMPQHCVKNFDLGANVDVWEALAKLCNVLKQVDISHVRLYKDKRENCEPVILSEDTMLCGFVPLLSAPFNPTYVHSTVDKDIARDCLRIQSLQMFGDYLCGIETPMLSFDVETKCYSSTEPSLLIDEAELEMNIEQYVTSEDEAVMETEEDDITDGEEMKMLKAKKEELKKRVEKQSRHQQNIQALLRKQRNCCIEIEIQPVYLVPDTNCFIDHLLGLQKLIFSENYTISVPLIVINELDGLVRGNLEGHYESIEHSDMVKENARLAMTFLEQQFEQKNPHLRAQTTKGTMLQTILYRSEATDTKGNNDDLILTCCLHYCKDTTKDFIPKGKDEPNRIYRDVVLLTDDRNLRLKAHTYNVPVKDVPSFLKWCKVT
ncbi:telomerase-binding protein EST1A-like isoform X2 [Octopus sinensis]|uniref:Telomerase-binding protein EST1A n=1 Tax=Octopus sinensis TaxID=2607531 RepID=A0A7E6EWS4_9MOLL|nr:telomerase-binding protein EST1A-like isoform X2 [Octopus sinensis]